MSNRFVSIFVLLCGLLLAPQMLAIDEEKQASQEKKDQRSESDMTWSAFWGLFGYERTAKPEVALSASDHGGDNVVTQNPLYVGQPQNNDSTPEQASVPAELIASSTNEEPEKEEVAPSTPVLNAPLDIATPVAPLADLANPASSAQPAEKKEESQASQQASPAQQSPVPDELMESRVLQFADANKELYQRAFERFSNDKANPLVFHITNGNPDALWLGLINLGLDKNEITANDLMWIIDQYAKPSTIQAPQAEQLFRDVILAHLKGTKVAKVTNLLTEIAIKPKNGYFYSYSKNEKFNVLVNTMELGYYNQRYTKALKEIISLLPAEKIDGYNSVALNENDKTTTLTLASWMMRDKGYYLVKGYGYSIDAAVHMFSHRLKHNVPEGTLDLEEPIASLATILLKGNHIQQDQYGVASRRFITEKTEKKE